MGQSNILKLLKKEKRWMSSKEISKKIGVTSVHRSLNILCYKSREIDKKEVKTNARTSYYWRIK